MKYHTLFCRKLGKMSQNLSSAAVVIGALRANLAHSFHCYNEYRYVGMLLFDFINLTQVHNFTISAQDIFTFR